MKKRTFDKSYFLDLILSNADRIRRLNWKRELQRWRHWEHPSRWITWRIKAVHKIYHTSFENPRILKQVRPRSIVSMDSNLVDIKWRSLSWSPFPVLYPFVSNFWLSLKVEKNSIEHQAHFICDFSFHGRVSLAEHNESICRCLKCGATLK